MALRVQKTQRLKNRKRSRVLNIRRRRSPNRRRQKKREKKPKTTKKYSGSLDRNSFRNVRRQEFGAGTAPFVFVGLTAGMMYLLFQEEDD